MIVLEDQVVKDKLDGVAAQNAALKPEDNVLKPQEWEAASGAPAAPPPPPTPPAQAPVNEEPERGSTEWVLRLLERTEEKMDRIIRRFM